MNIPFTKMQAYGNDYVYVNAMKVTVDNWNDLAIKVSNRNFGVGSDGLILICDSQVCDFRMRVFDPDGTECEMCGNALRSVAKYVYYYKLTDKTKFTIETYGGNQVIELNVKDGDVKSIHANIGKPVFDPEKIIVKTDKEEFMDEEVMVLDKKMRLSSLSWGNPHTVTYVDDLDNLDIKKYGPAIENHELFPNRTNVTFACVVNRNYIKIREWERGTGETIGCGTGCCTAAVFSNRLGLTDRSVDVEQIGGILHIDWDDEDRVHMIGESHVVYEGEYYYEA